MAGPARGAARDLRGTGRRPGAGSAARARRDRRGTAAAAGPGRRALAGREGPRELLGLQHHRLLHARAALLRPGRARRLPQTVRRLHAAGIEVILDVVYNHTAESDHLGPTLSFRGLDNAAYYRLQPGHKRFYVNDTGCGNTLNVAHPYVLRLALDSRSEEHTSELQSLMRISYAVFCLKKKK